MAAGVLEDLGVRLEQVRAETGRILYTAAPARATDEPPSFVTVVVGALDEQMAALTGALHGLTGEERRFQPGPQSHHIDFVVWHLARVEDNWIQRFAQTVDTLWSQGAWHQRLGLPEQDSGNGYTADQVGNLPAFDLDDLMQYYRAVRAATLSYMARIGEADLTTCPRPDERPGYTVAKMLSHLLFEAGQHTGQASYLRGLQRGIDR